MFVESKKKTFRFVFPCGCVGGGAARLVALFLNIENEFERGLEEEEKKERNNKSKLLDNTAKAAS